MGETDKNLQDKSSLKDGQPSVDTKGTTSKDTEPETYSKEQVEQNVTKAVSDALAKAGRDDKTLSARDTALKAREDAIAEQDRRRDAAELLEAQKDPDTMAAYQAKQVERDRAKSLDEREVELNRSKAEHEADLTSAKETQREIIIHEIASAKGIDPMRLKTLSEKFNVEGKQKIEELADEIATGKGDKNFEADNAMTKGAKKDLGSQTAEEKLNRGFAEIGKK